jgi:hypothetical protein
MFFSHSAGLSFPGLNYSLITGNNFPQLFKRKPSQTHTVTSKNFKEELFYKRIRISGMQVGKIFYVPERFFGGYYGLPLVDSFSRIILNISEGHMTQNIIPKPLRGSKSRIIRRFFKFVGSKKWSAKYHHKVALKLYFL